MIACCQSWESHVLWHICSDVLCGFTTDNMTSATNCKPIHANGKTHLIRLPSWKLNHSYTLISYFQNFENKSKKSTRFRKQKIRKSKRKLVRIYELETLRWLDWIFWGGYLPSLSINYVGISKDMEKRLPQLYYIKMKNSYGLSFIAIGVAMAT